MHEDLLALPRAELRQRAAALRDAHVGTRVTYSPKVFIPLTMLCRDKCGYCTFAQPPARLDHPYLSPEQVLAIATEGVAEANVDPIERMRLEQLARVAEVQINGATGLSVVTEGRPVAIEPVNRSTWVLRTIEAFKPRFEALARQISVDDGGDTETDAGAVAPPGSGEATNRPSDEPPVPGLEDLVGLGDELSQFDEPARENHPAETGDDLDDGVESWLTNMLSMLSPMLLGMTAGSLIAGPLVDKSIERSATGGMILSALVLAAFGAFTHIAAVAIIGLKLRAVFR